MVENTMMPYYCKDFYKLFVKKFGISKNSHYLCTRKTTNEAILVR